MPTSVEPAVDVDSPLSMSEKSPDLTPLERRRSGHDPRHVPTPDEIRQMCEAIQATWSTSEREFRKFWDGHQGDGRAEVRLVEIQGRRMTVPTARCRLEGGASC